MLGICSPQNSFFIFLSTRAEGQTSSFGKFGMLREMYFGQCFALFHGVYMEALCVCQMCWAVKGWLLKYLFSKAFAYSIFKLSCEVFGKHEYLEQQIIRALITL